MNLVNSAHDKHREGLEVSGKPQQMRPAYRYASILHFFVAQSRSALWDPMGCSPPGSSVHWIFQARVLEWGAISYSRGSSRPRDQTQVSCVSCIGRGIPYHCTTWEADISMNMCIKCGPMYTLRTT